MQEMWAPSLGREDPLEKEMAIHSSILAWEIPRAEEPTGLQSMGSLKRWTWLSDLTHCYGRWVSLDSYPCLMISFAFYRIVFFLLGRKKCRKILVSAKCLINVSYNHHHHYWFIRIKHITTLLILSHSCYMYLISVWFLWESIPVFSFIFWPDHVASEILVPWPGIDLGPSPVKALNSNHWIARGFLKNIAVFGCWQQIQPIKTQRWSQSCRSDRPLFLRSLPPPFLFLPFAPQPFLRTVMFILMRWVRKPCLSSYA